MGVVWENEVLASCFQFLKELCLYAFLHLVCYYGNKTLEQNVGAYSHMIEHNITAKYSLIPARLLPRKTGRESLGMMRLSHLNNNILVSLPQLLAAW